MENEGADGEPNDEDPIALNPWTGVPGLPKGTGPAAVLWPKAGVAIPKLKPGVCVVGLEVPN